VDCTLISWRWCPRCWSACRRSPTLRTSGSPSTLGRQGHPETQVFIQKFSLKTFQLQFAFCPVMW